MRALLCVHNSACGINRPWDLRIRRVGRGDLQLANESVFKGKAVGQIGDSAREVAREASEDNESAVAEFVTVFHLYGVLVLGSGSLPPPTDGLPAATGLPFIRDLAAYRKARRDPIRVCWIRRSSENQVLVDDPW
jgi:hypothetical protein